MATQEPEVGSRWYEGRIIWEVTSVTLEKSTKFYHMHLIRGHHPFALNRVVEGSWFGTRRTVKRLTKQEY